MKYFIAKNLFYSLSMTFVLLALLELLRSNFVTNFLNVSWFFVIWVAGGVVAVILKPKQI